MIEGETMRGVISIVPEEARSGDWRIGGKALFTGDVQTLAAGKRKAPAVTGTEVQFSDEATGRAPVTINSRRGGSDRELSGVPSYFLGGSTIRTATADFPPHPGWSTRS